MPEECRQNITLHAAPFLHPLPETSKTPTLTRSHYETNLKFMHLRKITFFFINFIIHNYYH